MKRKLLSMLFALTMLLTLLPTTAMATTTGYNLWVGGTRVTESNKSDVLSGTANAGKVSYNSDTNTLTLNGATISFSADTTNDTVGYGAIAYKGDETLNLIVTGEVNVTGESKNYGINVVGNGTLNITGTGTLNATGFYGIDCKHIKVGDTVNVTATGSDLGAGNATYGLGVLYSLDLSEKTSGAVKFVGKTGAIRKPTSQSLEITLPSNYKYKTNTAMTEPSEEYTNKSATEYIYSEGHKYVEIVALSNTTPTPTTYNLWIGGTQVTSSNCNDLATKKWSYDDATKTLTLNGFSYTGDEYGIHWKEQDNLIVQLAEGSTNTITNTGSSDSIAIKGETGGVGTCSMSIQGAGTLNATGSLHGIWVWNTLTIQNGAVVTAKVNGNKDDSIALSTHHGNPIVIKDATVTATGGLYGIGSSGYQLNALDITGDSVVTASGNSAALQQLPVTMPSAYWWRTSDSGDYKAGTTEAYTSGTYVEIVTTDPTPVTNYNLWVGDERVTSANATDVFGDGKVSFTAPNTLTLKGYAGEAGYGFGHGGSTLTAAIYSDLNDGLTIMLEGTNSLSKTNDGIKVTKGGLTIAGSGSLTVTNLSASTNDDSGLYASSISVEGGANLTVNIVSSRGYAFNGATTIKDSGTQVIANAPTAFLRGTPSLPDTYWWRISDSVNYTEKTEIDGTAYTTSDGNTYVEITTVDPTAVTTYAVTVVNGTAGSAEYAEGATVTITANAAPSGQQFKNWTSDDVTFADATAATTTFTMPAQAVTVTANYETIPTTSTPSSGSSDPTYSIKDITAKSENGEVDLQKTYAHAGDKVTLTLKADDGYVLDTLVVTDAKGNEITVKANADGTFTFEMPKGQVEVEATFKAENPFTDVAETSYYHDAVLWAVENGITQGATATSFAPGKVCTRAQIVTFLWRAAGCPAPVGTENPFGDVQSDAYYYDAVLWAVEQGITQGLTANSFAPQQTVTRGQSMTFLWRLDGAAAADGENAFTDVPANAYFADAVQWAVEEEITNGMTASSFAPGSGCTRGQIVTFLYRYLA